MELNYKEIIEKIIKEYIGVAHKSLVIKLANEISGLEVDGEGRVIAGANKENLLAFIEHLTDVIGIVSFALARKIISILPADSEIKKDLPSKLK